MLWTLEPSQIYDLKIFSPILWLFFHFLDYPLSTKVFNFDKVQFFFSSVVHALVSYLRYYNLLLCF